MERLKSNNNDNNNGTNNTLHSLTFSSFEFPERNEIDPILKEDKAKMNGILRDCLKIFCLWFSLLGFQCSFCNNEFFSEAFGILSYFSKESFKLK